MPVPVVREPSDGATIAIGGSTVRFLLLGDDTDATSSVEEMEVPGRFDGPPAHVHRVTNHAWYVARGRARLTVDGHAHDLAPGGFAFAPAGVPHTFANPWDEPTTLLQMTTPGGFDRYLRELADAFPAGTEVDPERIVAIMARHDTFPV